MLVIKNNKLRHCLRIVIPFLLIPSLVLAGAYFFREKRYAIISLAITILALFLFITGFERKQTGSRRMVLTAIFIALTVAGRFIPLFKPVTALIIIGGIFLGGEAGFFIGALSAVISNIYFGQGPWTPFQMFAWGMIGLFAGFLAGKLKKSRLLLFLYGGISGVLFSLLMDVWTVLWYQGGFDINLYLAALITALPHTTIYVISNIIFLALFFRPFQEKLERICTKYGII